MKLSIIVPMYNSEKYINNCINSLLKQNISNEDYEILIVNDGSIDNSKQIVEKYQRENINIKLISVENGGQAYARNIGVKNASGKYLFFVDSDDYITEYSLDKALNKTIDNEVDMMFFDLKRVNNDKEKICRYANCENIKIINGIKYFTDNNVNNGPWHFFISRKFIIKNNIFFQEGRFCEDGMFLISCIFSAVKVSYCNVDIYRYVIRDNSTTTNKSKEHILKTIEDFMFAIEYIDSYYKDAIDRSYCKEFLSRLKSRRNSYIYFMQIRMIKSKVGFKYANDVIRRLKTINCYTYSRMRKDEYGDFKTTLIWRVLNCRYLFVALC